MTVHTPSPANPYLTNYEDAPTRPRRELYTLLAAGVVAALLAGTAAFLLGGSSDDAALHASATKQPATTQPAAEVAPAAAATEDTDLDISTLTADDAATIVTDAHALMRDARWDEAASRLELVTGDLAQTSGAAQLAARVAVLRTRWNDLGSTLRSQVDAGSWKAALATAATLEGIATLDDELVALRQRATDGLAQQQAAARQAAAARAAAKAQARADAATTAGRATGDAPVDAAAPSTGTTATDEPTAVDDPALIG